MLGGLVRPAMRIGRVTGLQQGEVISDVFVGRELELGDLAAAVSRVQEGQPWLVTIEGQSGVGKTALTRRALAEISGLTVLSARADPAESDLDHGIVDQLVRGVDAALLAQFPLLAGGGGTASPFAVGAQFLGVIGELQTKGAVAVVVDDLQWCDKRSMEALTFAFRRLTVDAVLVVLVVRGDTDLLDQTARRLIGSIDRRLPLRLLGLRVDDVAPLAAALGAGTLDGGVVQSLYEATGGHTLYLRTILAEGFGSDRPVKGPIPLPPSLTAAIRDHLALLPVSTRISARDAFRSQHAPANGPVARCRRYRFAGLGHRTGGGRWAGRLVARGADLPGGAETRART